MLTTVEAAELVAYMLDLWPVWKPPKALVDRWVAFLVAKNVSPHGARSAIHDHLQNWPHPTPNMKEVSTFLGIRKDLDRPRMNPRQDLKGRGDFVVYCESHPKDQARVGVTHGLRIIYGTDKVPDRARQEVDAVATAQRKSQALGGVWAIKLDPVAKEGGVDDEGHTSGPDGDGGPGHHVGGDSRLFDNPKTGPK